MSGLNNIFASEEKLMKLLEADIALGASFVNIFNGYNYEKALLILTSLATHKVRITMFSSCIAWTVKHADVRDLQAGRSVAGGGYIQDLLRIWTKDGTYYEFQISFIDSNDYHRAEIAANTTRTILDQLNDEVDQASSPSTEVTPGAFDFDPNGPEKAGMLARTAGDLGDWLSALQHYVVAVDRLHDFYCYENFRNRQPSPADAWLVDGLTHSLGVTRQMLPNADISEPVRTATHRLRTMMTASQSVGANHIIFKRALVRLEEHAPDVDVTDIFWD